MPLDFPNSPTVNQTYTGPNNVMWQWDGAKWVAGYGAAGAYAPINSPAFSGDPQAPTAASGDADASIATTAFVQAAVAPALHNTGRNLLHNPLFNIAQRGVGPFTVAQTYTLDRWFAFGGLDTLSFSQLAASDGVRAAVGDEAATFLFSNVFTGNAAAGAYHALQQPIEGLRRLAGKTVTVSFWAACAAGALKVGINYLLNYGTGGSPSASVWALATGQSVTLSTTWTRYSVTTTLPTAIGKTLGTNNNDSTGLTLWFSSGTTINAFAGNIGVQSGTVQLWGVQLEIGSVATPLEKPDLRYDLSNCQRFYQVIYGWMASGYIPSGSNVNFFNELVLPVTMRATPTVAITNVSYVNASGLVLNANNQTHTRLSLNVIAGGTGYGAGDIAHSADL